VEEEREIFFAGDIVFIIFLSAAATTAAG